MYFQLNPISIAAALLFFAAAYAVGIKKQTWILRGFRRERVRDQVKLAKIAGYFFLNSGFLPDIQAHRLPTAFPKRDTQNQSPLSKPHPVKRHHGKRSI